MYLFARSAGMCSQLARIVAPDANGGDLFGFRVHLTRDELWVTAPFESSEAARSGALYVFEGTQTPTQVAARARR